VGGRSKDVSELCRFNINKGRQTDHLPQELAGATFRIGAGWASLRIAERILDRTRAQRRFQQPRGISPRRRAEQQSNVRFGLAVAEQPVASPPEPVIRGISHSGLV
jgi:hypothetical protein